MSTVRPDIKDAVLDRYAELCLETEQWAGATAERAKRYGV